MLDLETTQMKSPGIKKKITCVSELRGNASRVYLTSRIGCVSRLALIYSFIHLLNSF